LCSFTSMRSQPKSLRALTLLSSPIKPGGMAPRPSRFQTTSRSCSFRHAHLNSTAKKISGNSCGRTGCRTEFSNPSTISSTTAATLGTRSSTSPGRSCPSPDATGQQSVTQTEDWYKPWLLPLIGAGAASLPSLVVLFFNYLAYAGTGIYQGEFIITDRTVISFIISALYGGAAGMLIRRFGIPKAVTIPIIPAFLLLFALLVVFYSPVQHGYVAAAPLSKGAVIVNEFIWLGVSPIIAWLPFRLHSLFAIVSRVLPLSSRRPPAVPPR